MAKRSQVDRGVSSEDTASMSRDELRALGFCGGLKADKMHRCLNWAGARTDHPGYGECKYHGGNRESNRMNAAKAELEDRSYTLSVEIEPTDALRQALYMSAGAVAYCQLQIRALEEEQAQLELNDMGYHANLKSRMLATWMSLYSKEREAMVTVAEKCLKAGVAERHVRAIEHRAGLLGDALAATLAEVEISAELRQQIIDGLRRNLAKLSALPATMADGSPAHEALPTKVGRKRMAKAEEIAAQPADYDPQAQGVFDEG